MDDKVDLDHMGSVMSLPPAPVVLVGVGDRERNIITVGMFNVFSVRPPIIGTAVTTSRHSYKLLEENEEFTVSIPGKELMDKVSACGEKSGSDTDKFKLTGLTAVKGKRTKAPRIAERLINIEAKRTWSFEVGDHAWYLGGDQAHRHRGEVRPQPGAALLGRGVLDLRGEAAKGPKARMKAARPS